MKYLLILLLFTSCEEKIRKIRNGRITFIGYVPPHEESYGCGHFIGKIYFHRTCYRWVNDTTWYITFSKIIEADTTYREIMVSRSTAHAFNVGDSIEMNK